MAPKKKDISLLDFIAKGNVEQDQLRPEQRGIHSPAVVPKEKAAATRKRFTVNLELSLIDQARNAVANTLGLTLSALVEQALRKELAELAKKRGTDHQVTPAAPKKGRPVVIKA